MDNGMEKRVVGLESSVTTMHGRVGKLEKVDTNAIRKGINNLEESVVGIHNRVGKLESVDTQAIEDDVAQLQQDVIVLDGRVDTLDSKYSGHEEIMQNQDAAIITLDGRVDTLTSRANDNEGRIDNLEASVIDLDGRVDSLERAPVNWNAETLDGKDSTAFLDKSGGVMTGGIDMQSNFIHNSKFRPLSVNDTDMDTIKDTGWYYGYTMTNSAAEKISTFEVIAYSPDWIVQNQHVLGEGGEPNSYTRKFHNGTTWSPWRKIYNAGNDGAGSGLDADKHAGVSIDNINHVATYYTIADVTGHLLRFDDLGTELNTVYTIKLYGTPRDSGLPLDTTLGFFYRNETTISNVQQVNNGLELGACEVMIENGLITVWIPPTKQYLSLYASSSYVDVESGATGEYVNINVSRHSEIKSGSSPVHKAVVGKVPFAVTNNITDTGGTMTGGLSFGSDVASSTVDTRRHITLFDVGAEGTFGFGVTTGAQNYVTPTGSSYHHTFYNGLDVIGVIESTITSPKSLITREYADANYVPLLKTANDLDYLLREVQSLKIEIAELKAK